MPSLTSKEKKKREKVILETEAMIRHYGKEHCLAGTLTLNGYYPPSKISKMFTQFINRMRPHIIAYYGVMDNSKHKTPHIHYILVVRENVQEGIDLEVLAEIHELKKKERAGVAFTDDAARLLDLRTTLGKNAARSRLKGLVCRFKKLAGFAPVFDLDPLYRDPVAIAVYMGKAYGNAIASRPHGKARARYRIVYCSRNLPDGIKKPEWSFTRLTPQGTNYRMVLKAASQAFNIPEGEKALLQEFLGAERFSDITGAIWEFINRTPRPKKRSYKVQTVKKHFEEKFPNMGFPALVPLNPGRN